MNMFHRLGLGGERTFLARKRLYQAILAGSAIFTAGIGIKARTTFDDFDPVAYGPVENDRVEAYADVVKETASLSHHSMERMDPNQGRAVARKWVDGMEKGQLKPLAPIAYEDTFDDVPAKDEILGSSILVLTYLNHLMLVDLAHRNYPAVADDAILCLKVSSVLKYSDLSTVGMMALHQRKTLWNLQRAMPWLSPNKRRDVSKEVMEIYKRREPLSRMTAKFRSQYLDYFERRGYDVHVDQKTTKVRFYDASPWTQPNQVVSTIGLSGVKRIDEDYMTFLSTVLFAYRSEGDTLKAAKQVIDEGIGPAV